MYIQNSNIWRNQAIVKALLKGSIAHKTLTMASKEINTAYLYRMQNQQHLRHKILARESIKPNKQLMTKVKHYH